MQAFTISSSQSGIVTASKLNIRTKPDINSQLAADPLIKGAKVMIVGENCDWYEVFTGNHGWVAKKYIG
ncbi:MAG: N-acetylmuramoyl-L-alanine amidase [Bacteroidota bacterium]|nr:N-acetylmuramoyl-L-alanine amidase [Bacteroidota bacterium]